MIKKIQGKLMGWFMKRYKLEPVFDWDAYTANPHARYDRQTAYIIRKVLGIESNSIDVGAHMGEILDYLVAVAPVGKHFAFEPLPHLCERLKYWYSPAVTVYPYALSDREGTADFNHVVSNPYYSGLQQQQYPGKEEIKVIPVQLKRLDDIIPADLPIHLIKIDVEGGEFNVLKGATELLKKWKPVIIYEQGLGSAEYYGTEPGAFYDFMASLGYKISLMDYYISGSPELTREDYIIQFVKKYNYYFVAY